MPAGAAGSGPLAGLETGKKIAGTKAICLGMLLDLKRPDSENRREHLIDSMVVIGVHVEGLPG